jgi:hypothetical protein
MKWVMLVTWIGMGTPVQAWAVFDTEQECKAAIARMYKPPSEAECLFVAKIEKIIR